MCSDHDIARIDSSITRGFAEYFSESLFSAQKTVPNRPEWGLFTECTQKKPVCAEAKTGGGLWGAHRVDQPWIMRPSVASVASCMLSAIVGWACIVEMMSSAVASSRLASPISAISSLASSPMMCAPRISP